MTLQDCSHTFKLVQNIEFLGNPNINVRISLFPFQVYRMVLASICEHASSAFIFAGMRAVRLFLRARAMINFLMRAASTLEITNVE